MGVGFSLDKTYIYIKVIDVKLPICFVAPVFLLAFVVKCYEENEKSMLSKENDA